MANRFNIKPTREETTQATTAVEVAHVLELKEQEYEAQVTAATMPVVLDFYGADSKPCEALAPRYAAVAEKFAGKVRFLKASRLLNPALAARLGITAAPTVVFFKNGQELGERLSGDEILRTALKARVEALLA